MHSSEDTALGSSLWTVVTVVAMPKTSTRGSSCRWLLKVAGLIGEADLYRKLFVIMIMGEISLSKRGPVSGIKRGALTSRLIPDTNQSIGG